MQNWRNIAPFVNFASTTWNLRNRTGLTHTAPLEGSKYMIKWNVDFEEGNVKDKDSAGSTFADGP